MQLQALIGETMRQTEKRHLSHLPFFFILRQDSLGILNTGITIFLMRLQLIGHFPMSRVFILGISFKESHGETRPRAAAADAGHPRAGRNSILINIRLDFKARDGCGLLQTLFPIRGLSGLVRAPLFGHALPNGDQY